MKRNSTSLFRKTVPTVKSDLTIDHLSRHCFMGSCFSQNIAEKFENSGLYQVNNPFGISFNPVSIAHHLSNDEYDLISSNDVILSWQNHSSVYNKSMEELEKMRSDFKNEIAQSNVVFVTFGSAWVYELKEQGKIVSNCHKQPSELFEKRLLRVDEIVAIWKEVILRFSDQNFVFTVSPVRHWKDGVRENNVSKGVLHQAIHQLINLSRCSYYPSYEIVMDELRDYRFFAGDMLHPNSLAVDYIWQHFQETYCDEDTKSTISRVEQLRKNLNHKPFHTNNEQYQEFVRKNQEELESLHKIIGRPIFSNY